MSLQEETVAGGTATLVSRWAFNCYVVHDGGDGSPVVIDPGAPSIGAGAATVVDRLAGAVTPVVACTHGHLDHVGGVSAVCDRTGAGYHLPAPCEAYLAGTTVPRAPGLREVAKIAPVLASQPFDAGILRELAGLGRSVGHTDTGMTMPTPPDGFLIDGQPLPGAAGWRVLQTPGHTEDSTCLYHAATATLLSGDTVLTHEGQAWINPEVVDPVLQAGTEARLRSLPVEHLLPGHGRPISGADLLGRARSFRERPRGSRPSVWMSRLLGSW